MPTNFFGLQGTFRYIAWIANSTDPAAIQPNPSPPAGFNWLILNGHFIHSSSQLEAVLVQMKEGGFIQQTLAWAPIRQTTNANTEYFPFHIREQWKWEDAGTWFMYGLPMPNMIVTHDMEVAAFISTAMINWQYVFMQVFEFPAEAKSGDIQKVYVINSPMLVKGLK